ncbi:hypothetical protein NUW54_g13855 [Trametes sanguinea]|uniref:Uncharacterized protein n=1 Tax=Trametes sanguinea TaxID=158606 RepID=A0ACC1MJ40_9APHY|nr:hypothetical protein NUW54_g13855 [Trametes sanguinea]
MDSWSVPRGSSYVSEQDESSRAPSPATKLASADGESAKADQLAKNSERERVMDAQRAAEILAQMEALRLEFAQLQLDKQGDGSEKELSIKKEEEDVALSFSPRHSAGTLLTQGESQPRASSAAHNSREPDLGEAFVDHTLRASREARTDVSHGDVHVLRPVRQVQPQSYLGHAFRELAERNDRRTPHTQALDEGPPSDPSSSSSEESSSDGSSSSLRAGGRGRRDRTHRTKRSLLRAPTLKPREPTAYGGAADTQVFHRFIQEMTAYIDGYQLPAERHALTISWFLKGKAYQFYLNTVSDSPRDWDLRRVMVGLYDYCFPLDHRQRMREKLSRTTQGNRSVRDQSGEALVRLAWQSASGALEGTA